MSFGAAGEMRITFEWLLPKRVNRGSISIVPREMAVESTYRGGEGDARMYVISETKILQDNGQYSRICEKCHLEKMSLTRLQINCTSRSALNPSSASPAASLTDRLFIFLGETTLDDNHFFASFSNRINACMMMDASNGVSLSMMTIELSSSSMTMSMMFA